MTLVVISNIILYTLRIFCIMIYKIIFRAILFQSNLCIYNLNKFIVYKIDNILTVFCLGFICAVIMKLFPTYIFTSINLEIYEVFHYFTSI